MSTLPPCIEENCVAHRERDLLIYNVCWHHFDSVFALVQSLTGGWQHFVMSLCCLHMSQPLHVYFMWLLWLWAVSIHVVMQLFVLSLHWVDPAGRAVRGVYYLISWFILLTWRDFLSYCNHTQGSRWFFMWTVVTVVTVCLVSLCWHLIFLIRPLNPIHKPNSPLHVFKWIIWRSLPDLCLLYYCY